MKKLLIYLVPVIIIILLISWYFGFWASVQIQQKAMGPYYLVMIERKGNYNESPKIIDSLQQSLLKDGFKTKKGFGIYFNDAQQTSSEKCRSIVGVVLEDKDTNRLMDLLRRDYRVEKVGLTQSLVVDFAYRNRMSVVSAQKKVIPEVKQHIAKNNFRNVTGLEVYDGNTTTFIYEIKQNHP